MINEKTEVNDLIRQGFEKNNEGEVLYNHAREEAKHDENILGYILGGGRGKGVATDNSDYDVYVIVDDEKIDEYKEKFKKLSVKKEVDFFVFSITEFKNYAAIGSDNEWNRYNFAHLKAQVDRADIQDLIDKKGRLPEEKIKETVEFNLGAYINQYYRALKNNRDGNLFAASLDGAESIQYLVMALFAMNGRVRPYNKFLEWELKNHPLEKSAWSAEELVEVIKTILTTGDIEVQKKLFKDAKELFYKNDFTESIDGWDGHWLGE